MSSDSLPYLDVVLWHQSNFPSGILCFDPASSDMLKQTQTQDCESACNAGSGLQKVGVGVGRNSCTLSLFSEKQCLISLWLAWVRFGLGNYVGQHTVSDLWTVGNWQQWHHVCSLFPHPVSSWCVFVARIVYINPVITWGLYGSVGFKLNEHYTHLNWGLWYNNKKYGNQIHHLQNVYFYLISQELSTLK